MSLREPSSMVCVSHTPCSHSLSLGGSPFAPDTRRERACHRSAGTRARSASARGKAPCSGENIRRKPEHFPPPALSGNARGEDSRSAPCRIGTCKGDRRCACSPRTCARARCPESREVVKSGIARFAPAGATTPPRESIARSAAPPETRSSADCIRCAHRRSLSCSCRGRCCENCGRLRCDRRYW